MEDVKTIRALFVNMLKDFTNLVETFDPTKCTKEVRKTVHSRRTEYYGKYATEEGVKFFSTLYKIFFVYVDECQQTKEDSKKVFQILQEVIQKYCKRMTPEEVENLATDCGNAYAITRKMNEESLSYKFLDGLTEACFEECLICDTKERRKEDGHL